MASSLAPRFFATNKKGENFELKADLNSEYREKRKETVKRVIANMTIGKDVSSLFADVVKNMQTDDLELKKLVYLYLINYAKTQPELVILVVNTFVKDTDDPNPLIRALAIRTMGCLRAEKILDYVIEPLKKGLRDDDPYVRKVAALCVAKIYDLNPQAAIDNGLIEILQDLVSDKNPMVIANAVAALDEIRESNSGAAPADGQILTKLLAALNECTEWGQVCILSSLANYTPQDSREACDMTERVLPRIQHANASVVLAAIKVLLLYQPHLNNDELHRTVDKKMAPPLITLLASEPEIQYVALRNMSLILQRSPHLLKGEIRIFFTKYNDPPYVKLEKLTMMLRLVDADNVDQVLSELIEYANEVDIDFSQKAVAAVGRCALQIPETAERCVETVVTMTQTKTPHVIQAAMLVFQDILRQYPGRFNSVIPTITPFHEVLDDAYAKAALIWIVGEHVALVPDALAILSGYAENFREEPATVQVQLLTAVVRLFLFSPQTSSHLVQEMLSTATSVSENPDIRDRAFIYWRLLSSNVEVAQAVVSAEKPPMAVETRAVPETLLDELMCHLGSLASIYYKPAAQLGQQGTQRRSAAAPLGLRDAEAEDGRANPLIDMDDTDRVAVIKETAKVTGANIENLLDLDFDMPASSTAATPQTTIPATSGKADLDILTGGMGLGGLGGLGGATPTTATTATAAAAAARARSPLDDLLGMDDLMGSGGTPPTAKVTSSQALAGLSGLGGLTETRTSPPLATVAGGAAAAAAPPTVVLEAARANGLQIAVGVVAGPSPAQPVALHLTFTNTTPTLMTELAIQFNVNPFGLAPVAPLAVTQVPANGTVPATLLMGTHGGKGPMAPPNMLQVAVKNQLGTYYFAVYLPDAIMASLQAARPL